jgi:hypothetical protein
MEFPTKQEVEDCRKFNYQKVCFQCPRAFNQDEDGKMDINQFNPDLYCPECIIIPILERQNEMEEAIQFERLRSPLHQRIAVIQAMVDLEWPWFKAIQEYKKKLWRELPPEQKEQQRQQIRKEMGDDD